MSLCVSRVSLRILQYLCYGKGSCGKGNLVVAAYFLEIQSGAVVLDRQYVCGRILHSSTHVHQGVVNVKL